MDYLYDLVPTLMAYNLAILWGRSGVSTTADNPLILYSMAQIAVRKVDTKSKNVAILYGKSGISAIADNSLSPYSLAQLFELVPSLMADSKAKLYGKTRMSPST